MLSQEEQEARRQRGSQRTQPLWTLERLVGETVGSRLHLFISQSVTVVRSAAEKLLEKGTEIGFVYVPWHLLLLFKGRQKNRGWGGWGRESSECADTLWVSLEKRKLIHFHACIKTEINVTGVAVYPPRGQLLLSKAW